MNLAADRWCQHCGSLDTDRASDGRWLCEDCFPQSPTEPFFLSEDPIEPSTKETYTASPRCNGSNGSVGVSGTALWGSGGRSVVGAKDETLARAVELGVKGPLRERFPCVIPDHEHLARLSPTTRGYWQYECDGLDHSVGLGEVRAFLAYGVTRRVSDIEAARWRELLDFEAGLLQPRELSALPDRLSPTAMRVGEGIRLFLGLRDDRWAQDPFVFARDFAVAYCAITDEQAKRGVQQLEAAEVIERAGTNGRAIKWRPGPRWSP
jgi:hypothetical protein